MPTDTQAGWYRGQSDNPLASALTAVLQAEAVLVVLPQTNREGKEQGGEGKKKGGEGGGKGGEGEGSGGGREEKEEGKEESRRVLRERACPCLHRMWCRSSRSCLLSCQCGPFFF